MLFKSISTCRHECTRKEAAGTVWTPQTEQFDVFSPALSLFSSLQVSWQPCLVFWQWSLECWCQLREGREWARVEGLGERERGEREEWAGYSRHLSSVSLLSTEEGEAHMYGEKRTRTRTSSRHIFTACSSEWQQQAEWEAALQGEGGREREREGRTQGRQPQRRDFKDLCIIVHFAPQKDPPPLHGWTELCYSAKGPAPCNPLWQPRWDMGALPPSHLDPLIAGWPSSACSWLFLDQCGALTWTPLTLCTSWETVAPSSVSP